MQQQTKTKTKCDFCRYCVGKQCTAADSMGKVNSYYCKSATYEFYAWLNSQKKGNRK